MSTPSLVLDVSALQGEHAPERGIPRYVVETVRALLRRGAPVAQLALSPLRPLPDHLPEDLLATGLVGWLTQRALEAHRRAGPTVLHVFSPFELITPLDALYPPASCAPGCATTVTVYDAIPQRDRARYLVERLAAARYDAAARHVAASDHVLAISEHSARDAVAHLGVRADRVTSVGTGANHRFLPVPYTGDPWPELRRRLPALREGFVLTVGGDDPRKNVVPLLRAFAQLPDHLRKERQLVQVGWVAPDVEGHWRALAHELGIADDVVLLGRVDDDLLRGLYQTCEVFAFPSAEEGFGLPVLEAARCGAVVVTSDRSAVPEILDCPETTFDPTSVGQITAALVRALDDEGFRARARAAAAVAAESLTWDAVAERMWSVWSSPGLVSPPGPARRHLALVGRFGTGPDPRGATRRANSALAAALGRDAVVTCFETDPVHLAGGDDVVALPARALGTTTSATAYDDVVHLLDPDPTPVAVDLLRAAPGPAVLPAGGFGPALAAWAADPGHAAWYADDLAGVDGPRRHPALRTAGAAGAGALPHDRPFGTRGVLAACPLLLARSDRDASLTDVALGPARAATTVGVLAPTATGSPPTTDSAVDAVAVDAVGELIVVLGRGATEAWPLDHAAATLGLSLVRFDPDRTEHVPGPPTWWPSAADSAEADRGWCEALARAAVVVDLDDDPATDPLHRALEAVAAGVPVLTRGTWAGALPAGAVRVVEPGTPPVTFAAHVMALAQDSPLRRAQLDRAAAVTGGPGRQAADLLAHLDGEGAAPAPSASPAPTAPTAPEPWRMSARSSICRVRDFARPEFEAWCRRLQEANGPRRKLWEYVAIARALEEHDLLAPGRRGLGFGVGTEPLTAAFAAAGASVLATDLDAEHPDAASWAPSAQLATRLDDLDPRGLCPPDELRTRVSFRPVDMTAIPDDLVGFDFCWSSCAFEHLGSLDAGLGFVRRSLDCLRPGGVAVHTTEYLLSSFERTLVDGPTVLFRADDLHRLADELAAEGHRVAPLDLRLGDEQLDLHVDVPPFAPEPHLKLELGGHVTTSVALVVQRGGR